MKNYDDKDLAIVCILLLGIGAMLVFKEAAVVGAAITAIAALATGRTKKGE